VEDINPYQAPLTESENLVELGDKSPFATIWTAPRATIRNIVEVKPTHYVIMLAGLNGITETLNRLSERVAGDQLSLTTIIAIALLLGPLSGLIGLYLIAFLLRLTGGWIGGTAPSEHLRAAIAWASVPSVFALLLWIPELALIGSEMFTSQTPRMDQQPMLLGIVLALGLVELILGIWGFILLCNTVAEVQGFRSAWAGLGNLLLAFLILFGVLLVFVILGIAIMSL
jgi:hypothetical protein